MNEAWEKTRVRCIDGFRLLNHGKCKLTLVAFVLYLFCNLLNYTCLYSFKGRLPAIDVIAYLHGQPYDTDTVTLNSTLGLIGINNRNLVKDIYLRNEKAYLEKVADSTILVTPLITYTKQYVSVNLLESFYNFTSASVSSVNPQIGTDIKYYLPFNLLKFNGQSITQLINYSTRLFYEENFESQYLTQPLEDLDKFKLLTHMSNLLILVASALLVVTLASSLLLSDTCWLSTIYLFVGTLSFSFVTILSFQFLNLVVVIHNNHRIHDLKFLKKFFITFGQIVLNVMFSFKLYFYCLELIYVNVDDIIANYNSNSIISPNSGYALDYADKDTDSDFNVKYDLKRTSDEKSRLDVPSESSSVYSEEIPKNEKNTSGYNTTSFMNTNGFGTPPNDATVATSVQKSDSSYRNIYTGPIKVPKSSYSTKRSPILAVQRHLTAPLPFQSPGSVSTGFEQFKKDLMKPSSHDNIQGANSPVNSFHPLLARSSSELKLNTKREFEISQPEANVDETEDLSLKRVPANVNEDTTEIVLE